MIFYKNIKKHKSSEEKNLVFSIFGEGVEKNVDDSISKPAQCKNFYNLSFSDGSLKTGLGFQDLTVPETVDDLKNCHKFDFASSVDQINDIWVERWFLDDVEDYEYRIMLIDSKNVVWYVPLIDPYEAYVWVKTKSLKSFPTYTCQYRIENTDCTLFFSEEGMVLLANQEESEFNKVPPIISCVVHYDNFFGITNTNRNTLIYTKNLNLKEWSDSDSSTIEFLDNRGSFTKLVAFNDYVYLFREYGITKISIYSSKSDFSFTHLYTSPSKIFENSICVCGDTVFFATRDGLYSFNGNSVNKIASDLDNFLQKLDNTHCSATCLNGKYYLATRCDFQDGEIVGCEAENFVNNVLFEIDIYDFKYNLYRGVDIKKVLAVDNPYMSKLCACFNQNNTKRIGVLDMSGSTFEANNKKSWTSTMNDFGYPGKRKRVKEIVLTTLYDIDVEIRSDEESKSIHFSGSKKEQCVRSSIRGKTFQISFKTGQKYCEIKKPMIVFDVEK